MVIFEKVLNAMLFGYFSFNFGYCLWVQMLKKCFGVGAYHLLKGSKLDMTLLPTMLYKY